MAERSYATLDAWPWPEDDENLREVFAANGYEIGDTGYIDAPHFYTEDDGTRHLMIEDGEARGGSYAFQEGDATFGVAVAFGKTSATVSYGESIVEALEAASVNYTLTDDGAAEWSASITEWRDGWPERVERSTAGGEVALTSHEFKQLDTDERDPADVLADVRRFFAMEPKEVLA